ncbi:MAG: cytochrome c biogenesis protein/redoxin [Terriglobia bacterium]
MADIGPLVAFLAGFLSFLSPCVLPLVPGYISLMSGVSVERLKQGEPGAARAVAANAVIFILGFSVVFIAMGASASAVGAFLNEYKSILYKIAGVIIILFGFFLLGVLKIPALYREKRYHGGLVAGKPGTFLLGLAFAFGWTPCIGPILGALLLLAATKETVAEGVLLLAIYSLGLGIPFLLTALGINKFLAFYQGFRRHLQWVERFAGVLLIAVGLLVATNQLTWLASYFAFFNRFSLELPLAASIDSPASSEPRVDRRLAPDVALTRADGSTLRLSELRGKVVVVNFWASWCLPCRLEIPFFNQTYQEYGPQGVEFVGISVDDGGWKDIDNFRQETPIEYLVVLDPDKKAADAFGGLPGLPVTFFIDRQGRIAYKHVGITDIDLLRANIEALL